ncbi:MAG: Uma2 family endonuclease [Gemmatales bacterium]
MASVSAPPVLMTAEEFVARHEHDRAELVRGVVVELPMPFATHAKVCSLINYYLTAHVLEHELGQVMGNDTFMRTERTPDSVRGADVMYFSYDRLPKGPLPNRLLDVSPDLVVEVRSPSDRLSAMSKKALEYLGAGVRAVILLDPERAAATVFRDEELPQTFHNGDSLSIPEILPGFEVKLAKLFS